MRFSPSPIRLVVVIAVATFLVLLAGSPQQASAASPEKTKSKGKSGERTVGERRKARKAARKHARDRRQARRRTLLRRRATKRRAVSSAVPVTSTPQDASGLLFKGTKISDFLNQSAPGAVSEVPDPAGGGETVFRMTVGDSDVYPVTPTENPRAELVSDPIASAGDEIWASMKFLLPADFPSVSGWLTLLEGPYGPPFDGSPPWHLEVNGSKIAWVRNGTYNWDVPWSMPVVRNSWITVTVHEVFASDGWIEMWINGQQITFFGAGSYNPNNIDQTTRLPMQTMDASTDGGGGNSFHLMNYRQRGMFDNVTVYQGPLLVGTSRAAVEG